MDDNVFALVKVAFHVIVAVLLHGHLGRPVITISRAKTDGKFGADADNSSSSQKKLKRKEVP
jgi:hypothetical protein